VKKLMTVLAIAATGLWSSACGTEDVDMNAFDSNEEAIEFLDANGVPCEPDLETWVPGNDSPDGPQDGTGSQAGDGEPGEDCDGSGEPAADSDRTEVNGRGCDAYGCCGVPAGAQGEGGGGSGNGAGDGTGTGDGEASGSGGESGGGGGSGNGAGGSSI
jgi:hypothetical protein